MTAVRGTADNPMPRGEVITKCRDLIEPVLGKAKASQLIDAVMGIEALPDIRVLRGMLQKAILFLNQFCNSSRRNCH